MLLDRRTLAGIAEGRISLILRRWRRPSVRSGGTLTTAIGVLAIDAVEPVSEEAIDDTQAKAAGFASRDAALKDLAGREGQLHRIRLRLVGPDPRIALREAGNLGESEGVAIAEQLARLDRRGPWTRAALGLIAAHPGRRAPELAALLGRETAPFKQDVRKLKALGLTESLEVGYRLSPRGQALMSFFGKD